MRLDYDFETMFLTILQLDFKSYLLTRLEPSTFCGLQISNSLVYLCN